MFNYAAWVYRAIALVSLITAGITLGLTLSYTHFAFWMALVLGVAWLVLGLLAWRDSRRSAREARRYSTPPTYVGDRQYPRHHWRIQENRPQEPLT
jgi:hypothetical protein